MDITACEILVTILNRLNAKIVYEQVVDKPFFFLNVCMTYKNFYFKKIDT